MNKWLIILIGVLIFLVGIILGIALGMDAQQRMIFEGLAIALSGSNVDINIDLNETELVNQFNETIVPEFKDILTEGLKKQEDVE